MYKYVGTAKNGQKVNMTIWVWISEEEYAMIYNVLRVNFLKTI